MFFSNRLTKFAQASSLLLTLMCVTSHAEIGFLPARQGMAPDQVIRTAQRSLQIWMQGPSQIYDRAHFKDIEAMIASPDDDLRSVMTQMINRRELKRCLAEKAEICQATTKAIRGTGFVLEDGTLVTVRHNFSIEGDGVAGRLQYLEQLWSRQLKNSKSRGKANEAMASFENSPLDGLIFLISDQENHIVFDSTEDSYRFRRFGNLTEIKGITTVNNQNVSADILGRKRALEEDRDFNADWVVQDVVALQIAKTLPTVKLAKSGCEVGDVSYNTGYARGTSNRSRLGYADAADIQLVVSKGRFLSPKRVEDLAKKNWSEVTAFLSGFAKGEGLFNDGDSTSGMSGGMILNQAGEVCGLIKATYPSNEAYVYDQGLNAYMMFSVGRSLGFNFLY